MVADKEARQFEQWDDRFNPGRGQVEDTGHDLRDLYALPSGDWLWRCWCYRDGTEEFASMALAAFKEHVRLELEDTDEGTT